MTNRMLFSIAALAGVVTYCFHRGKAAHAVKGEVKQDLHRWEGEGGNVPQVATPSPAPVPQSSYPGNGSVAPH
ncbi:MAG: hypothetical protein ACXWG1_09915 [Usitatibacter sp.]